MKPTLFVLAACALGSGLHAAERLPNSLEKPFLGCFVGFDESRDFEFAIGGDATSELFFKKGRNRHATGGCTLNIYYVVEEQVKDKAGKTRWSYRKIKEDGLETAQKETAQPGLGKPISFTATFTGETKVEITHAFTKEGVEISSKLVGKKTSNKVRAGVRVVVGDMFRHIKDEDLKERTTKSKLRDTRVTIWPVDGKKSGGEKIKFDKFDLNLPDLFPKGAERFSLKSDRIADHEFALATANPKFGSFEFRQRKALLHGFDVYWWPDPAKIDEKDCRMVIEVK